MRRSIMPTRLRWAVLAFALAGLPVPVAAQNILDQGSFRLTVAGQEVGSERFSIRQDGAGASAVTIAQGTVALDSGRVAQELTSWLRLSPVGARAAEYRLSVQGSSREQITGTVAGGRFSARIVSPAGEMMREYLAADGAVIVDDGMVHQYYFLAQRAGSGTSRIAVLIPRQSRQVTLTATAAGADAVEVAGRRVEARRLVVSGGGLAERQLWVDAQGRVLRLTVPSTGFEAVRTSL